MGVRMDAATAANLSQCDLSFVGRGEDGTIGSTAITAPSTPAHLTRALRLTCRLLGGSLRRIKISGSDTNIDLTESFTALATEAHSSAGRITRVVTSLSWQWETGKCIKRH
jgi:hypothetical protein